MPTLLMHTGVTFRDQVVYATGHCYEKCTFHSCTIICMGIGPGSFSNCAFGACVWHVNMVIHDSEQWDHFMTDMAPVITKSLGRGA